MDWIENGYKGFRNADNTVFVGETPGRYFRVWQRGADGWTDTRQVFPSAAEAKAHAETLAVA